MTTNRIFAPVYPPVHDDAHVKTNLPLYGAYYPYNATDPSKLRIGTMTGNSWAQTDLVTPAKFNVDLGVASIVRRVYIEGFHSFGTGSNNAGYKHYKFYGTNSPAAFENTDTSNLADLTLLGTFIARPHFASNVLDPQYFVLSNVVAYRYMVAVLNENLGSTTYAGIRHIEYQVETALEHTTFNPNDTDESNTFSNDNRTITNGSTVGDKLHRAIDGFNTGKHYWEFTLDSGTGDCFFGFSDKSLPPVDSFVGGGAMSWGFNCDTGKIENSEGEVGDVGRTAGIGDVVGIALDMDTGEAWWSVNGLWSVGSNPSTGLNPQVDDVYGWQYPACSMSDAGMTSTVNFGDSVFASTAPTGFNAGVPALVDHGTTCYPPDNTATYTKATFEDVTLEAFNATTPSGQIGLTSHESWQGANSNSPVKFNIDLGSEKLINNIRLANKMPGMYETPKGIKSFTVYGSNTQSAFDNTTYSNTDDLIDLGAFVASEQCVLTIPDFQEFSLSTEDTYRYFILRILDNYGDAAKIGFNAVEFQEVVAGEAPVIPYDYLQWNKFDLNTNQSLSNGDKTIWESTDSTDTIHQTHLSKSTGKWYWEITLDGSVRAGAAFGLAKNGVDNTASPSDPSNESVGWFSGGTRIQTGLWFSADDISPATLNVPIGIAFDADTGEIWVRHGTGSWESGDPVAGTSPSATVPTGDEYAPYAMPSDAGSSGNRSITINSDPLLFISNAPTGFDEWHVAEGTGDSSSVGSIDAKFNLHADVSAKTESFAVEAVFALSANINATTTPSYRITQGFVFSAELEGTAGGVGVIQNDFVLGSTLDFVSGKALTILQGFVFGATVDIAEIKEVSLNVDFALGAVVTSTRSIVKESVVEARFLLGSLVEMATNGVADIYSDFALHAVVDTTGVYLRFSAECDFVLGGSVEMGYSDILSIDADFTLGGTVEMATPGDIAIIGDFVLSPTIWVDGQPKDCSLPDSSARWT